MSAEMQQWVVFRHPEYPDKFAVRRWWLIGGQICAETGAWVLESLEDARSVVAHNYPGAYRIDRYANDDATIIEVWI